MTTPSPTTAVDEVADGIYRLSTWLPDVAPTEALLKRAQASLNDPKRWKQFVSRYRSEMKRPEARHLLDLLAALSHTTDFSVGCYCADESRCHRSILRELLSERGAKIATSG